jgi:hypothetical protein
MKKKALIKKEKEIVSTGITSQRGEEIDQDLNRTVPIEEFIKIKKLQNEILGKMLEKINHPEQKKEIKKNKNK